MSKYGRVYQRPFRLYTDGVRPRREGQYTLAMNDILPANTHPLSSSMLPDGKVFLELSGSLTHDAIDALSADISAAQRMIETQYAHSHTRVKVLLDMSMFDGTYVAEALELVASLAKHDADIVEKTACFGGSSMGQLAGDMVAAFANRTNIQFFKSKDEALEWLG